MLSGQCILNSVGSGLIEILVLTLTSPGCKYYISPLGLWPVCSHYPPPCAKPGGIGMWVRGCSEDVERSDWSGWGEGGVCGNYIPTEPGHDPSHLQFTNRERSWPAPCGNILVTLLGFFWHFTKIRMLTVVFNRNGWVKLKLDIMLKGTLARDFWLLFFFIKSPHSVPWFIP